MNWFAPTDLVGLEPLTAAETILGCGCRVRLIVKRGIQIGGFGHDHRGGARYVTSEWTEYEPCEDHLDLVAVVRDRYAALEVDPGAAFEELRTLVKTVTAGG